ncbi:conserved hypothetical protein (putative transposase or invertase) [Pedobacter sp. ok626]|uniref:hypothetical protein n=1 Tax=Pedobacter sp. ok626 TaxID=1761882 RepID=UPI0008812648|nr:hypothetical protein [Pedobacter sp. ok626]SDL45338.1 conserved hypothetical protein (putative transposase or invertase) [Pedobacter sp. ok626]
MSKLTKEQRELYESDIKAKSDWKGGMDWAKEQAAEQASEKAAKETTLEIASKLKAIGRPSDEIAKVTGLSTEEIDDLPGIDEQ